MEDFTAASNNSDAGPYCEKTLAATDSIPDVVTGQPDRWAPAEPREREVVIQFDMESGMAHIYTAWPGWYSRLLRNPSARLLEVYRDERGRITGAWFEVPVALVSIRSRRRSAK